MGWRELLDFSKCGTGKIPVEFMLEGSVGEFPFDF
jgi:hypothetical protein